MERENGSTEAGDALDVRALVERAAGGDPSSQTRLLALLRRLPAFLVWLNRRHGSPLSRHEINDVLQDVYVNLWRKLPAFHGRCAFEAWAFAFGRRQYRAALRRRFETPQVLGDSVLKVPERPAPDAEHGEELTDVLAALGELDPQDGAFVFQHVLEGRSFAAIASEAQLSISMVKSRFYRSVARLRCTLNLRRLLDSLGPGE